MKKILLFHIYPINNWKDVTTTLIGKVPHDVIAAHVSLPFDSDINESSVKYFLSSFKKIRYVFFSNNSPHPEVDAMKEFLKNIDLTQFGILTYMHTKGVTKPNSQNVKDWTELMRYFIIEKMPICERVFKRGYLLYGVNKTHESNFDADFFYAGNFISVHLVPSLVEKLKSTPIQADYHGLEGFWGKLCDSSLAYNVFHSRIDHYTNAFPESFYKNGWRRMRYSFVSFLYHKYYRMKYFILKS